MGEDYAFKVTNPKTGHEYKIWADGRIEGFGDATMVVNRIPQVVATAEGAAIARTGGRADEVR